MIATADLLHSGECEPEAPCRLDRDTVDTRHRRGNASVPHRSSVLNAGYFGRALRPLIRFDPLLDECNWGRR